MQQIIRAFYRALDLFQFLVKSWPTIVGLISVYKRLRDFEKSLKV
jgi:peptide/bleomycin uptake transporter